jgi:hypothetical protein
VANGPNNDGAGPAAPGAPIKIPDIVLLEGQPIESVMNSLIYGVALPEEGNTYTGFLAQCGGKLCVKLATRVDPPRAYLSSCVASGVTDPPLDSLVPRGSTIWILTGGQPCEPGETPYPPSGSPSGSLTASPSGTPTASPDSSPPASPGGGQSPGATSSP